MLSSKLRLPSCGSQTVGSLEIPEEFGNSTRQAF